jgi:hypothetical protein
MEKMEKMMEIMNPRKVKMEKKMEMTISTKEKMDKKYGVYYFMKKMEKLDDDKTEKSLRY